MTDLNTAAPAPAATEERVYRWDDPALDDLGEGEAFTVDIGTGPTLLIQPYREAVNTASESPIKTIMETEGGDANVVRIRYESPDDGETIYVDEIPAQVFEAAVKLWGFLYGYPPALKSKAADRRS